MRACTLPATRWDWIPGRCIDNSSNVLVCCPPGRAARFRLDPLVSPSHVVLVAAALAFHGIGFFDVGVAVFTGRLGWLAERIVPCGPKQRARTTQEWVQLLRSRLAPVVHARR